MKNSSYGVARRKLNQFNLYGSFSVVLPLDEVFVNATDVDEAILESTDGVYKKTLKVVKFGKKVDDEHIQVTFHGVIPGKKYTLTYDTKLDATGSEVAKLVMFNSRLITVKELEGVVRKNIPLHNIEEDGDATES